MAKQKIAVVTDSTAAIPKEAQGDLTIPVIPLWLIWGEERYRDGIDIQPAEFYKRLKQSSTFPTTSQPSAGEFIDFFRTVSQDADGIVGIFISSGISGTVQSALTAQAELRDIPIRVVDSHSTSMGLGFAALAAAKAAQAGATIDDVAAAADSVRQRLEVLFSVETLEYLHRGGRIGGAKRFLGTALNIKPVLELTEETDGKIEPLAQIRTKRKAVAYMLDEAEERLDTAKMAEAAIIDVDSKKEADRLAMRVKERFGLPVVHRTIVSPVIGAHAGPGTVGIAFYRAE